LPLLSGTRRLTTFARKIFDKEVGRTLYRTIDSNTIVGPTRGIWGNILTGLKNNFTSEFDTTL
jgi:hypothetical protein